MSSITAPVHARTHPSFRPWWPWLATFAAFGLGGYLGRAAAGRVDSATSALIAGVVTGAVLGAGQWLLLRRRGVGVRWVAATSIALGVGLVVGARVVGYETDHRSLAIMGALSGLAVGVAQAVSIRSRTLSVLVWGATTAGLWAVAWNVSSGVIDVAEQWPIFGSSGAIAVVLAQSVFIERVLPLAAIRRNGPTS